MKELTITEIMINRDAVLQIIDEKITDDTLYNEISKAIFLLPTEEVKR